MATENAMGNGTASEWEPNEEGEVLPNPEHARASERPSHMCITVLVSSVSSCDKKTFSCTCIRVYMVRASIFYLHLSCTFIFSCIDIRTFLLRKHASTNACVLTHHMLHVCGLALVVRALAVCTHRIPSIRCHTRARATSQRPPTKSTGLV